MARYINSNTFMDHHKYLPVVQFLNALVYTCFILFFSHADANPVSSPGLAKKQAEAHYQQATKLRQNGQHDKAIEQYRIAYTLVPHPIFLYNIAEVYEQKGDKNKAIQTYEEYDKSYLGQNPATLPDAVKNRRLAARSKIAQLKREIEQTDPLTIAKAQATARFQRAQRFSDSKQYTRAIEELVAAYRTFPEPVYLYYTAQVQGQKGNKEQALSLYRDYLRATETLSKDSSDKQAEYEAYRRVAEERIVQLEGEIRAQRARESTAEAAFQQGKQYHAAGRYDEAIAAHKEAYSSIPKPLYLFHVGLAYEGKHDRQRAIETYEECLRQEIPSGEKRQAEDRLSTLKSEIEQEREQAKRMQEESAQRLARLQMQQQMREREDAVRSQANRRRALLGIGIPVCVSGLILTAASGVMAVTLQAQARQLEQDVAAAGAWSDGFEQRLSDGRSLERSTLIVAGTGVGAIVLGGILWGVGRRTRVPMFSADATPSGSASISFSWAY